MVAMARVTAKAMGLECRAAALAPYAGNGMEVAALLAELSRLDVAVGMPAESVFP